VTPLASSSLPAVLAAQAARGIDLVPILDEVEARLRKRVDSASAFVAQTARHLIEAGGKRFRPMILALAAHVGDPDDPRIADAAVVVELVHLATLYHDDVIDEAVMRRGAASANSRWDNTVAILTGDFLFARASELSAELGVEVTAIMARTIATLCEGQIREIQGNPSAVPPDVPVLVADVDHYLRVVSEKTASLIESSCRLGALLSGCDPQQIDALAAYGWNVGMAFQLSDDIIDVTGDGAATGKTPGTDLREGVVTLPVIHALTGARGDELRELLSDQPPDDAAVRRALELVRDDPAVQLAIDDTAAFAEAAVGLLDGLPDSAAHDALRELAAYTVTRTG